jgi:hypothetical protein
MLQLRGRRDEAAEDFDEWEEPEYDPSDVLALVNTGDPTDEDLARLFQSMAHAAPGAPSVGEKAIQDEAKLTAGERQRHEGNFLRLCKGRSHKCKTSRQAKFFFRGSVPAVNAAVIAEAQELGFEAGYQEDPRFQELSTLEFRQQFLGVRIPKEQLAMMQEEETAAVTEELRVNASQPKNFDAREKWSNCRSVIGRNFNQGQCGSCWAFATAHAFNDRHCIATGSKVAFSRQHATVCGPSNDSGCQGDWPKGAWEYFENSGLMKESCWAYNARGGQCSTSNSKCRGERYKAIRRSFRTYSESSTSQIKAELMQYGPMSYCMKVCGPFFSYKGGIFDCPHSCGNRCGHAMTIFGWGEQSGTAYWWVMNSWGSWGISNGGTVKVKMFGRCGTMLVEASKVEGDGGGGGGGDESYSGGGDEDDGSMVELQWPGSSTECVVSGGLSNVVNRKVKGQGGVGCTMFEFRDGLLQAEGGCMDFFEDRGRFGLWECHGGSNQQFSKSGSTFRHSAGTEFPIYGESGPSPTPKPTPRPTPRPTPDPTRSPTPAPTDADDDGGDGAYYYPTYYDDDDDDEASLEPVVFGSSALSSTRCQAMPIGGSFGGLGRKLSEDACKTKCLDMADCKYLVWKQNKKDNSVGGCTAFTDCDNQRDGPADLMFKTWKRVR